MIEKLKGISFPAAVFTFSNKEWASIESEACIEIPEEIRGKILRVANSYVSDISEHDNAVKADKARRILVRLRPLFEKVERELDKFTDANADLRSVRAEMERYGGVSPEGIMIAIKALENLPLRTGERDKAYLAARDAIQGEAALKFSVTIDFDVIYKYMQVIYECTKSAIEKLPPAQPKDGDPYLNKFIWNLSLCFREAGGIGVYTEKSTDFIGKVCQITAQRIEIYISGRIVYTIKNLTADQIKQRLKDIQREKSDKGR